MKKKIVRLISMICLVVIMASIVVVVPANAASYPLILDKYISYSVVEGQSVTMKYTIFREFNNEKYHIDLYDSNDTKVASVSSSVYGDYMVNLSINVNTADLDLTPGEYKVKYYMSFYSFYEWHYAPKQYTTYLTVVPNTCNSNHRFSAWETFVEAKCTYDGTDKRTCSTCGHFEYREVKGDHIWDEGTVTKEATCTIDGERTLKCTNCSEKKTEVIPAGHKWDSGKVETAASCTTAGKKVYTCSGCGETKSEILPASHVWDSGKVTAEATFDVAGNKVYTCSRCNETKNEVIPKKEYTDTTKIFKDIKAKKWYTTAVNYAYSYGFIAGVSDTEFGRDVPVTRGMFITILARIAGVDTSSAANKVNTKFSDVKSGKYYTNAIKWASENGVVNGLTDTTFGPNAAIERQQLCTMIVNFAKYMNIDLKASQKEIKFTDAGSIRKYAKTAVSTCQKAGIVSGYAVSGGTEFKPGSTATRAEAAQILYKFHSELFKK